MVSAENERRYAHLIQTIENMKSERNRVVGLLESLKKETRKDVRMVRYNKPKELQLIKDAEVLDYAIKGYGMQKQKAKEIIGELSAEYNRDHHKEKKALRKIEKMLNMLEISDKVVYERLPLSFRNEKQAFIYEDGWDDVNNKDVTNHISVSPKGYSSLRKVINGIGYLFDDSDKVTIGGSGKDKEKMGGLDNFEKVHRHNRLQYLHDVSERMLGQYERLGKTELNIEKKITELMGNTENKHKAYLEKMFITMMMVGFLGSVFFLKPGITGNVVGNGSSSGSLGLFGIILFAVGIAGVFLYFYKND
jgi:hypothetical protein